MNLSEEGLSAIYNRCSGKCHICHGKLARKNYGQFGARGAWEVDHSTPRAKGGSDHGNNLYPAHISCNRSKQHAGNRSVRKEVGIKRAPLSTKQRAEEQFWSAVKGGVGGGLLGARLAGPPGALLGGLIGALWGAEQDPDQQARF